MIQVYRVVVVEGGKVRVIEFHSKDAAEYVLNKLLDLGILAWMEE